MGGTSEISFARMKKQSYRGRGGYFVGIGVLVGVFAILAFWNEVFVTDNPPPTYYTLLSLAIAFFVAGVARIGHSDLQKQLDNLAEMLANLKKFEEEEQRKMKQNQSKETTLLKTRSYGLVGIGFFVLGLVLGTLEAYGVHSAAIFAWVFLNLGIFTALYGAIKAGNSWTSMAIVGIIYGVGLFYATAPHEVHVASGFGFGLSHDVHYAIGGVLFLLAIAMAAALSFRRKVVQVAGTTT